MKRLAVAALPVALLALPLTACGGGTSAADASVQSARSEAVQSAFDGVSTETDAPTSNPNCTSTDDIVVYTTFTDGEQSTVQKMGGCGRMGDTVEFLRKTVSPGTCQHVAPAAANPDLTGNETGVSLSLKDETASFGDAC